MVNWVTRRDVSDAAKGGAGFFALILLFMVGLFMGAWWWASGRPLNGEPDMPQWVRFLLRGGLFVGAFALTYADGPVAWMGVLGVFGMAGAGWWLMGSDETA